MKLYTRVKKKIPAESKKRIVEFSARGKICSTEMRTVFLPPEVSTGTQEARETKLCQHNMQRLALTEDRMDASYRFQSI